MAAMAATNSKIREQVAIANRNEARPIFKGLRFQDASKQKIDQGIISSNAENIQYDRDIEQIKALIEQEYVQHQRRIDDLMMRLYTTQANKGYLQERTGWKKTGLLIVRNRKIELNEALSGLHAKQTRQNKLKTTAFKYIDDFQKEARKKAKARSMGSVRKTKTTPIKRNSY